MAVLACVVIYHCLSGQVISVFTKIKKRQGVTEMDMIHLIYIEEK